MPLWIGPLDNVGNTKTGEGRRGALGTITGGGYDPAAAALFARFSTPPDTVRKGLINNLIKALKNSGNWVKLDALYLMAAADSQAARQNWIADLYNLTPVSAPIFTTDRGYMGDGAASYLTTGFDPTSAPSPKFIQGSAHLALWSRTDVTNAAYYDIGGINARMNARSDTANAPRAGLNNVGLANFGASAGSLGLFTETRGNSILRSVYHNAALLGTAADTSAPPSASTFTLCASLATSSFSGRQIAMSSIGAGLSAQNVIDMYSAINTYLAAVGAA